ncbi:uncharacterized protein At3g49140 isoform X2 [Cryptomeria japonica]|uniref:uncharacterized protein At3g49140 isoform X2 n=1 Tax=Cryptomeria japonica TaxID=3369 RepID=UPI0025ABD819|nr:uncharacterized protein At3g49140 isoform X2 [Cryptomeria japonica]
MAIAVNTSISSYSLLSGRNVALNCQGCYTEDPGLSSFGWKPVTCEGRMNKFGPSKQANGQCTFRFDTGNHYFGLSDCFRVSRAGKLWHAKVQVAADYSDSRSASFHHHGELGYHPLEEISDSENTERGESRLSYAEIARSTVEANHKAMLVHPGTIHHEPHREISLTELEYVIDDYGDIYFELNGDDKILRSPRARNPVNVFVGLDELQIYGEQERAAYENHNNIYTYNSSDTNDKYDYEEDWSFIDYEGDDSDHSETVKDWAKLDTMATVHPLHFAKKMVKAVSTNYSEKMDRPCNGVAIIGFLRPALMEEESYVQRFLYCKDYSSGDDNHTEEIDEFSNGNGEPNALSDKEEGKIQSENQSVFKWENMSDSGYEDVTNSGLSADDPDLMSMIAPETEESWTLGSESDSDSISSSMYKLEILSIQLISVYGNQSTVNVQDFQQAEPDILTHSSSEIIACFNNGSQKAKYALKALCQKKRGLDVEVTTENAAKKQIRHLLFPRSRSRHQKSRRNCYRGS